MLGGASQFNNGGSHGLFSLALGRLGSAEGSRMSIMLVDHSRQFLGTRGVLLRL
jgi:hypothetical protein